MKTSTKKPPIQYGKRGQRTASLRRDATHQPAPERSPSPDDTPVDEDDDELFVTYKAPTSRSPRKVVTPNSHRKQTRLAISPSTPTSKGKERQLVEVVIPSRPSPQRRQPSATSSLAANLKRKVTLEDVSSGVDSDDTLRLADPPRKRTRGSDTLPLKRIASPPQSTLRTPPKVVPYVEVESPKKLFGSRTTSPLKPKSNGKPTSPQVKATTSVIAQAFDMLTSPPKASSSKSSGLQRQNSLSGGMMARTPSHSRTGSRTKANVVVDPEPQDIPMQPASKLDNIWSSLAVGSSMSPRKPPAGIAKRMLARTRTEPELSVEPLSQASSPRRSGPSTPAMTPSRVTSSPNLSPNAGHSNSVVEVPTREPSPPPTRPAARTYGKSRSYLFDPTDSLLEGGDSQDSEMRESYKDLRERWGVDNSDDASGLVPSDLRSVTELRNKGESRRFLDELGYLFEGLEPNQSLSVRRSSAVEFLSKMPEPDFIRKARVADVLARAWEALREAGGASGDIVLEMSLVALAAFASQDPRDIGRLSQLDGFEETLLSVLAKDRSIDPFAFLEEGYSVEDAKRAGVGKAERRLLGTLQDTLLSSATMLPDDVCLSARLLASQGLQALGKSVPTEEILPPVLTSLLAELSIVEPRIQAYTKGLDLLPPTLRSASDLYHIDNCLKILHHCLFGRWAEQARQGLDEHVDELAGGLVALGVYCEIAMVEGSSLGAIALKCFNTAFQILITFCETQQWSSAVIASPWAVSFILRTAIVPMTRLPSNPPVTELPSSDGTMELDTNGSPAKLAAEAAAAKLDIMCYALALLTNILQKEPRMAELVGKRDINPTCTRQRNCIKSCHCSGRIAALKALASLYEVQSERADDTSDAEATFLRGHLAVMLALLAEFPANQKPILAALSGSSPRQKVDSLITVIRDFLTLHTNVTKKMEMLLQQQDPSDSEGEEDDYSGKGRSQEVQLTRAALASSLHSGDRDSEAVNPMIKLLEDLRDSIDDI